MRVKGMNYGIKYLLWDCTGQRGDTNILRRDKTTSKAYQFTISGMASKTSLKVWGGTL